VVQFLGSTILIQNSAKSTQLIVSTQSPLLIDYFSVEDVVVVNRNDGTSTFQRLQERDFDAWLQTYSVGELWSKNVISGGPVHE
jgi:predicted ATPase